jgi:hypothetical protein
VTVTDKVAIELREEEQAAVSERAMNWRDRCGGGMYLCFIPRQVCLRKKEQGSGKGDAS